MGIGGLWTPERPHQDVGTGACFAMSFLWAQIGRTPFADAHFVRYGRTADRTQASNGQNTDATRTRDGQNTDF